MKVLHVNSGNETGGGMFHILSLLKQLKDKVQTTLVVFHEGELADRARNLGVDVEVFPQRSRLDLSVYRRLKHYIKTQNVDILHSHGARANFISFLLKRKALCTWFVTVHSNPFDDFLNQGVKGKIFTYLNVKAIKAADCILAISEAFRQQLIQLEVKREKIRTILNGIDFSVKPEYIYERKQFGLQEDDFVIMMVARLEHVKKHETALQAVKKVEMRIPVKLVLIGDGSRREELEKMAESLGISRSVLFLGHRDDVMELLPLCDITLLTSQSESFPLVLLESARAKKPFISTDVGGVKLIAQNGKYGRMIEIGDDEDLARQMEELYQMKKTGRLAQMGKELYHYAKDRFSEKAFAASVLESYREVLFNLDQVMSGCRQNKPGLRCETDE